MTVTAPAPAPRAAAGGMDAGQIIVAGMQRMLVAPVGTAPPDDIGTEVGADWTDLGYTTEDGIAFSFGLDTDDLMTSQSLDPVRKLTTGRPKTIAGSLRQFNETTLILALGGGTFTSDADGWEVEPAPSSFIDERALIVEFEDGAKLVRFIGYRVMVSEAVEFTLVNTTGLAFPLTFSVLANEPHTYRWQGNPASVSSGGGSTPLAPTVSAVTPNSGDPGDAVTLTGTSFAANLTVTFGTTPATGVQFVSATSATCAVPAGTPEAVVDVVVTVPGAPSSGRLVGGFTYAEAP